MTGSHRIPDMVCAALMYCCVMTAWYIETQRRLPPPVVDGNGEIIQ